MYCIRNNVIYEVELIKPSKRGSGFWCKVDNSRKLKLISASKIFIDKQDALDLLTDK